MTLLKKQFLGIDIGTASAKAVVVQCGGKECKIHSCGESAYEAAGVLNEDEVLESVGLWLKEAGGSALPACIGLPQYCGSTMLADFPKGSKENIPKLVAFETSQLAGVSEEQFIHSYQVLPPAFQRECPVIIAVCNEQALAERLNAFQEKAGGDPKFGCLNAVALLNAFAYLEKEACSSEKPVLLLDVGMTSTTLVIAAAGIPLYTGALGFGTERMNKALESRLYQNLNGEGIQRLQGLNLQAESSRSPMLLAARQLEDEIQQAVEHWRTMEKDPLAKAVIDQVFISGGGARIGSLAEWLQEQLETPVRLLGPTWEDRISPEFTIAFGLALSAAGSGTKHLPLMPEIMRKEEKRLRRIPFLAVAVLFFAVSLSFLQISSYQKMGEEMMRMDQEKKVQELVNSSISELKGLQKKLRQQELQALPVLRACRQTNRLQQALQAMAGALEEQAWFIYLGDKGSFLPKSDKERQNTTKISRPAPRDLFGISQTNKDSNGKPIAPEEFPNRVLAESISGMSHFVCAGYYAPDGAQPMENVRQMAQYFQEKGGFPGADLLPESLRMTREDLFQPWQIFLRSEGVPLRTFVFELPLVPPVKGKHDSDEEEE